MDQSLNDIADQILNEVYAGLKAPGNISISTEQIKDEFSQMRNRAILDMVLQGLFNPEPFRQTIPKLPLVKKDFSGIEGYNSLRQELWACIPEVLIAPSLKSIGYIMALDKKRPFKILFNDDFNYSQFDKYSAKAPTIWIQGTNLWLLNPPMSNTQFITMRGIFENPRSLNGVGGIKVTDDHPYPIPGSLIDQIRSKMVEKYLRHYRLVNPVPTVIAGDISTNSTPAK